MLVRAPVHPEVPHEQEVVMEELAPCPSCGIPVRLETMICWARLMALRHAGRTQFRMLPATDYSTQLQFFCPACHGALTFPLDAPTVNA